MAGGARGLESLELGVQLKVCLGWHEVSLRHKAEDVLAARGVISSHVQEEGRLLADLVDSIQVVVDLVGLELAKNPRSPHLRPDQIEKLGPLATPPVLLAQLLRAKPVAALDHGAH